MTTIHQIRADGVGHFHFETVSCPVCGKPLRNGFRSAYRIGNKPVHEDCYWSELGELAEHNPIAIVRVRRG